MLWVVYILKCVDSSLYTGVTNNLKKRVLAHQEGKGAKYTKGRLPVKVIYHENHPNRSEALKREIVIKQLDRLEKLKLIFDKV